MTAENRAVLKSESRVPEIKIRIHPLNQIKSAFYLFLSCTK